MAIPLVDIESVAPISETRWGVKTKYFVSSVESQTEDNDAALTWEYAFEGESGDESATVPAWIERIMVAAVAEGHLLVHAQSPASPEPSTLVAA
jgi:hypothetical protein